MSDREIPTTPSLRLGITGFVYADLFSPHGLCRLHNHWYTRLGQHDPALQARYDRYRQGDSLSELALSTLLVDLAPTVSQVIEELFPDIADARRAQRHKTQDDLLLFRFKEEVVKRRASKQKVPPERIEAAIAEGEALLRRHGLSVHVSERQVAELGLRLLDAESEAQKTASDASDPALLAATAALQQLLDWLVAKRTALLEAGFVSWRLPHPIDYQHLVPLRRSSPSLPEEIAGEPHHQRARDGFALTDPRKSPLHILAEVDYCLYCHERGKDSCSKGFRDKAGGYKKNPLGAPLTGCPLDEKISEAHTLRRQGDSLAALALVTLDNPMCAGTGHRICNDCMKSCIFQKQEPVNIPEIETSVLTDVLALPWGVEIYGLLQRWNPLHRSRPYPLPYTGKNVLLVGLGPAGYTLCHYLAREGLGVIAIDGLKLEPLPLALTGDLAAGVLPQPVYDFDSLKEPLDARILTGFGGVSEYGITVRWDKNFLKLLYLQLSRQPLLRMFGGVRFGGTLTLDDAWQLGFHHVAIATGAGKPTLIDMEGSLGRGIRQASDFLMGLQLTGAFKRDSLANLQVRLPALVIGGGLTAIDTATELLAYYIVQVEKTLARWEALTAGSPASEAALWTRFDEEERQILQEQLQHGREVRAERQAAAAQGRAPFFTPLIERFGGVTLVYRKSLIDSPAYRLNHEEVTKSLEEGIRYVENMSPKAAKSDAFGALTAVQFERQRQVGDKYVGTGEYIELPAKTMCIAAGTSPNTMYEKEHPGTALLGRGGYFAPHRADLAADGTVTLTPDPSGFFTSYCQDGRVVSYYGDNHPRFAGSVVRAMASAKHGYEQVAALFAAAQATSAAELRDHPTNSPAQAARDAAWLTLRSNLDRELSAEVISVTRLTPTIVDVKVRAPLAARKFQPGQFYRLQNLESRAEVVEHTRLTMEGLALTGASANPETGELSLIVLEMGGSSSLCSRLRPGEPVMVMGPTGTPTEIPHNETVCLVGGGLGNAVLFSIAQALKASGCRVLYFAGYRKPDDVFYRDTIESHTDQVVWCCDVAPGPDSALHHRRAGDPLFVGNIVAALTAYAQGALGTPRFDLRAISRFIVIGSDRMMAAVAKARHTQLQPYLNPRAEAIGSINSPMQCMMKEICAQCLQKHRDPVTGQETVVYTCVNQDQPLDHVEWPHLAARLRQNSAQEKLTALWLSHLQQLSPPPTLPSPPQQPGD
ncbi:MAG: FAD-dependent oxidoreductase [Myxococcales bacterium]|nr:FAD-dependent oxidoreductase [Myxococcales bacterium]